MFHPFFFGFTPLRERAVHALPASDRRRDGGPVFYPYAAQSGKTTAGGHATPPGEHMWAHAMEYHPSDTGKYNAGQKLMFWSMLPIIAILLLTGSCSGSRFSRRRSRLECAAWPDWCTPRARSSCCGIGFTGTRRTGRVIGPEHVRGQPARLARSITPYGIAR